MKLQLKRLCVAALLVLALQPIYLLALVATDYVAPPELRRERMQGIQLTPTSTTEECVELGTGLQPGVTGLYNAIMSARPLADKGVPCDFLLAAIAKDPSVTWWPYPRYWHGYRVLVDTWLTYLPIYPLRYLMLAAMIARLTWLAFELRFLIGAEGALALIVPTVVLSDLWFCWIYAVHAIPIAFIFAGSAFVARKARRPDRDLILIAALLGSLFNYIDFLHNVPWQPMLIAFVALAAGRRGSEAFAIVVAWFAGYSLTWASKWAIACAAGVKWSDIFEVILYRLHGDAPGYVSHSFLAPSKKVFLYLYHHEQSAMLFLILLPTLLLPTLLPVRWPNLNRFAILSLPVLIPFMWFELLSNHTQIHAWITYRPLASCFGILIAAAIIASRSAQPPLAFQTTRREHEPDVVPQQQRAD
jgi:hypothetical protein